ncbi:hypothetical protein GWO43_10355, partial [candidate division KSB1 bacterium]|nr:hypothetical protein [candidate division KSB1 bacterium]NIT71276.1 hypothetical protein [candidate division KSB1 bacterium]NIU93247.1 hypothetical protein [candidate division KSB1 bacterium]NIW69376.1 hypothetical protein [candidate division KSB1 bacterium]NIX70956.1 hypothetical protein [candidate division KSB1 bacterium]
RFLDRTISKVVALDKDTREASIHAGTFTDYMEEKEAALKRKWAQYQDAQAEKKRLKMSAKEKEKKAYTTE